MRNQLPELRLLKLRAEWFLMVVIFVASTVALYEHDDPAHNDVHTAGHEAIQSIRISVQRTGTAPTISNLSCTLRCSCDECSFLLTLFIIMVHCVLMGHEDRELPPKLQIIPLLLHMCFSLSLQALSFLSLCYSLCISPPLPLALPVRVLSESQDKTPLHSSLSRISCRASSFV